MLPTWVALLLAAITLMVTLMVTLITQARSDRRSRREEHWRQISARRERLRIQFDRALGAAVRFESLVDMWSPMWKAELSDDELKPIKPILDEALGSAASADIALRLEGETSALEAIRSIRTHFWQFRLAVQREARQLTDEAANGSDRAMTAAQAITAELPAFEAALLKQIQALVPPEAAPRSRKTAIADWFGFGD